MNFRQRIGLLLALVPMNALFAGAHLYIFLFIVFVIGCFMFLWPDEKGD